MPAANITACIDYAPLHDFGWFGGSLVLSMALVLFVLRLLGLLQEADAPAAQVEQVLPGEAEVFRIHEGGVVVFVGAPVGFHDVLVGVVLVLVRQGFVQEGVCGVTDQAAEGQEGRIRVGHEGVVRFDFAALAKVLDHEQGIVLLGVHPFGAVLCQLHVEQAQALAVVRADDDPRVVIQAVFLQEIQPFPDLQEGRNVAGVVLLLPVADQGHFLPVPGGLGFVGFIVFGEFRAQGRVVIRAGDCVDVMGQVVGHHQEGVLAVLRGLGHVGEVHQHPVGVQAVVHFPVPVGHVLFGEGFRVRVRVCLASFFGPGFLLGFLRRGFFTGCGFSGCGFRGLLLGFSLVVVALVVEHLVKQHRGGAHEGEAEQVPAAQLFLSRQDGFPVLGEGALSVELPDGGVVVIDAQVRRPAVAGVGRIADGDLIPAFQEVHRHDLQGLVLFFLQVHVVPLLQLVRDIFISAEQRRGGHVGVPAVGEGVGVPGKAGELVVQLRLFVEDVGQEAADGPVHHQDNDVFAIFVQGKGGFLLRVLGGGRLPDLPVFAVDFNSVHHGHGPDGDGRGHADHGEDLLLLFPQEPDRRSGQDQDTGVEQVSGDRIADGLVIPQEGGKVAVFLPEEHEVDHSADRGDGRGQGVFPPGALFRQAEIHIEPDQEGPRGQQQAGQHIAQGIHRRAGIHKLPGGGFDHRCGDQDTQQQRQRQAGGDENARGRLRVLRLLCFLRFLLRGPDFEDDVLPQGEEVVQRPVEDQARGGVVQEHQEHQRHAVELDLALEGHAPGIDGAGNDVDGGHEDRQQVDGHAADLQQPVRFPQVGDGAKGHALEQGQMGEVVVRRDEEGDLQQERQGALQGVERLVVVLAVVRLKDHDALVALEHLLDVVNAGLELLRGFPLLLLDGVRPLVQGQHQEVDRQAQEDDGEARVVDQLHSPGVNHVEQQLQGTQDQFVKHLEECQSRNPSLRWF